jgi:ribosomal-protein-alanine N-acetyltransferase
VIVPVPAVRVRPARPGDRPALRALRTALATPSEGLLDAALGGGAVEGGPVALVAVPDADPGPVGYALAIPGPADAAPAVVTLAELAVAPGARRAGVGSTLVAAVAARFPDHDRIRVTTRADDDRARGFYRSLGFERRARLPDYYGSSDAVRLDRSL